MPTLTLPTSPRSKAFRAFVSALKSSPLLTGYVKTWRAWDGSPGCETPWAVEQLPWVRLTPRNDRSYFADTQSQRSDILVDFEVALPTTNADVVMDFWTAVERAFAPADPAAFEAVATKFRAAGVMAAETVQAFVTDPGQNGKVLTSRATVRLWMMLDI